ncbi:MAG: metallophosphoesterase, partial [Clostridia bacterium]|nr:metallophosphoesterase [Clostridia bacterium]
MVRIFSRNRVLLCILVLLLAFCVTAGILTVGEKANAAVDPVWTDETVVAHLTDTHYYPLRFCDSNYGEEFSQYVQKTFTKMWLEAELAFRNSLERIKLQKPDYLVVSGDIAQDGERQSHIDVANALRAMQNEIREEPGMAHFQVFVAMGNHDLYNEEVFIFSDGTKQYTQNVSRKDVTKIYSSLGYPDLTDAEAEAYYSAAEYAGDTEKYKFINSTTATGTEITYQYESKEADNDYLEGEITYIAETATAEVVIGLDVVQSNASEGHVLGGTLTQATQEFLAANQKHDDYAIGIAHHSIVPHTTMEKEIMTGFIITDWINCADFLADYGMRYVFTGHVHANDIAHHISFNNNQITDFESSSNLSADSNVRYVTIKNGTLDDIKVQNAKIKNDYLTELDISDAIDGGYITPAYIQSNGTQEFVDYPAKRITDYSA